MPKHSQAHHKKIVDEVTPLTKSIVVYLNCAYYTLQCPFRLEYDRSRGQFVTKYNKYLRMVFVVVAGAAHLIFFYNLIILSSATFYWTPGSSEGYMKIVLNCILSFSWLLMNTLAKWELWHAPGRIEQLLMLLMRIEKKLGRTKWRYSVVVKYPAFFALVVYFHLTAFSVWEVSMALWNGNDTSSYYFGDSLYQVIRQSTVVGSTFYENQVFQVISKLVSLIVFVFVSIAYALSLNRNDYEDTEVAEVLFLVNEFSAQNKQCFGKTIAATCFCQLPFFAQYFNELFKFSWRHQCQYIYHLSFLLLQLWLGSEAHLKLSNINYLSAPTSGLDCGQDVSVPNRQTCCTFNRRALLIDATSQNSLSVRGHLMNFTYSFFGNFALWLLAYSITVIQFHSL